MKKEALRPLDRPSALLVLRAGLRDTLRWLARCMWSAEEGESYRRQCCQGPHTTLVQRQAVVQVRLAWQHEKHGLRA